MLYQLAVLIHLLSAIVWIGGMLFLVLVLVPVARRSADSPERATRLLGQIGRQFRPVGWVCLGLLVLTGLYLATDHWRVGLVDLFGGGGWFVHALQVKVGLVAVALVLSAVHDFVLGPKLTALLERRGEPVDIKRTRRNRSAVVWLARLNLLVALAVLVVAVMLTRGSPL